jgi:hypothetical protein
MIKKKRYCPFKINFKLADQRPLKEVQERTRRNLVIVNPPPPNYQYLALSMYQLSKAERVGYRRLLVQYTIHYSLPNAATPDNLRSSLAHN